MSYTNIPKPGAQNYTTLAKPARGFIIPRGTATGLLCPPTYNAKTIGILYTNIAKPTTQTYTNISKPT